jgi:enamine deaminase RidA (YjgF/YER057c/UK114 family)
VTVERRNVPGLAEPPGYRHVAIARGSRLVFTAGAVPLDAEGQLVGVGNYETQTDRVIANLLAVLEEAGATASDIVKTTVYVVGGRDSMVAVWAVVQRSSIATAPSTLIGVADLGYTGQLVEIEAVAVTGRT